MVCWGIMGQLINLKNLCSKFWILQQQRTIFEILWRILYWYTNLNQEEINRFFSVRYNINFAFTELLRQIFKNVFREMISAVRKLSYWLSKALHLEYSLKLNLRIENIEKRRHCIVQWIYINSFFALFFSFSSLWVGAWPSLQLLKLNWKSWRREKIPISSHAFLNMAKGKLQGVNE